MAAKKKDHVKHQEVSPLPPEDRATEAATVAWMLCVLFTACAEAAGLAVRLILAIANEPPVQSAWALLPHVTLAMSLVTGALALLLTGVVYRLRNTPPPSPITVVAILVGLAPWMRLVLSYLQ